MVTWDNYEEMMAMLADGELDAAQEKALREFVAINPELNSELELFLLTRMPADNSLIFPDKKQLLKPVPAGKIMAFPQWRRYSIAAGVAALFFVAAYRYFSSPTPALVSSRNENIVHPSKTVAQTTPPAPVTLTRAPKNDDPEKGQATMSRRKEPQGPLGNQNKKTNATASKAPDQGMPGSAAEEKWSASRLSLQRPVLLTCTHRSEDIPEVDRAAQFIVPSANLRARNSFWQWLPVDDIKKRTLETYAAMLTHTADAETPEESETDEKNISVRIENSSLVISF